MVLLWVLLPGLDLMDGDLLCSSILEGATEAVVVVVVAVVVIVLVVVFLVRFTFATLVPN